jgi:hypothetical protein
VAKRLYLTGAASHGEHFHDDFDLPNVANVGETCVTTTWIQFNAQLLRLTGEARFAEQLERVVLNQLFGAQKCDGSGWGYYVQMEGKKPYSSTLDGHCCLSSGPRGMALIPTFALSTDAEGVVVNLYETGKANLSLKDGTAVTLVTTTQLPSDERVLIEVTPAKAKAFTVKLRMPAWSKTSSVTLNGQTVKAESGPDGYAVLAREWKPGDKVELRFSLQPRIVVGDHLNDGKAAILYGPLVLAADEALLGAGTREINTLALPNADLSTLQITPEPAPAVVKSWPAARVFRVNAVARRNVGNLKAGAPLEARLIPFSDAGANGTRYKVWLPLRHASARGNLLLSGSESRSRPGNLDGSIIDESVQSVVVTFDGQPAAEDWYAVMLDEPAAIGRVVFAHGRNFPDGGWFDASGGKPRVQIRLAVDGEWQTVGELADYPATTATSNAGIKPAQKITVRLASPARAIAIRVVGKPAGGSKPAQAFSSCGELEAFAE